ncbi:MAG: hypothetical protein AAGA85_07430 [Bacteroidota bacterium]
MASTVTLEKRARGSSIALPSIDSEDQISGRIPTYVYASVFASLCVVVGVIWDISWHKSIGRDGLLSPPHLSIYLGAVVAGLFSGFKVLKVTIAGTKKERAETVKFWGVFHGSLGALFCIWGAIAMLTSAPFDDWWHNTYGLDVKILSPPHTVLALGIMMIQFGALVSTLSQQNNAPAEGKRPIYNWLFIAASGLLVTSIFTISSEYLSRHDMHHSIFYQVSGLVFPVIMVAVAKASKLRWAATATAAVYTFIVAALVWILPLFPAEPLLGPIRNHITHYQAFEFPILLIVPAVLIDIVLQRHEKKNSWVLASLLGATFILSLVAVQWPFGDFMMSTGARNWFFGTESWYYGSSPDWEYRYAFGPWHSHSGWTLVKGLAIALVIATLSSRLGLSWGRWMSQVRR